MGTTAPTNGRLTGRSAVVTATAKGIERATVELLAAEGARRVLTGIDATAFWPV